MHLAVLMPSRGVMASRMLEAVDVACQVAGVHFHHFYTHDRPLPECFNVLAEEVLAGDFTHGWFVEEDVIVPPNAVDLMVKVGTDIAAINYATHLLHSSGKPWMSSYRWRENHLLWVSLGCTLVRRRVFEGMERPWFRTDQDIAAKYNGDDWDLMLIPRDPKKYGGQDSTFCFRAVQAGFTLGETLEVFCEHLPPMTPEEVEAVA